jgi:tRNA(Ile)-lysidine synthase TilS/MesJ
MLTKRFLNERIIQLEGRIENVRAVVRRSCDHVFNYECAEYYSPFTQRVRCTKCGALVIMTSDEVEKKRIEIMREKVKAYDDVQKLKKQNGTKTKS